MVTVNQALQRYARNPAEGPITVEDKIHEIVPRILFQIANNPDTKVRGSLARSSRAQRIILNRLVGLRRAGSRPVTLETEDIHFIDLTVQELTL